MGSAGGAECEGAAGIDGEAEPEGGAGWDGGEGGGLAGAVVVCEGAAGVENVTVVWTDVVACTVTVLVTVVIGATTDENDEACTDEKCDDDMARGDENLKEVASTAEGSPALSCTEPQYTVS